MEAKHATLDREIREIDQLRGELQNLSRQIHSLFQDLDNKLVKERQETLTKLNHQ